MLRVLQVQLTILIAKLELKLSHCFIVKKYVYLHIHKHTIVYYSFLFHIRIQNIVLFFYTMFQWKLYKIPQFNKIHSYLVYIDGYNK